MRDARNATYRHSRTAPRINNVGVPVVESEEKREREMKEEEEVEEDGEEGEEEEAGKER